MKNGIDLIGSFERKKDDKGEEYYSGTINPTHFKKVKDEIQLVLMPGNQLPTSLIGTDQEAQDSLYLFSQSQ